MSTLELTELIENLSPANIELVENLVESLSKRQARNPEPPKFGWEGGLKELRVEYPSVELQKGKTPYERIKHLSGIIEGPGDLSTNPKCMEGFGLDRRQYEEMMASRNSENKEDS